MTLLAPYGVVRGVFVASFVAYTHKLKESSYVTSYERDSLRFAKNIIPIVNDTHGSHVRGKQ